MKYFIGTRLIPEANYVQFIVLACFLNLQYVSTGNFVLATSCFICWANTVVGS